MSLFFLREHFLNLGSSKTLRSLDADNSMNFSFALSRSKIVTYFNYGKSRLKRRSSKVTKHPYLDDIKVQQKRLTATTTTLNVDAAVAPVRLQISPLTVTPSGHGESVTVTRLSL